MTLSQAIAPLEERIARSGIAEPRIAALVSGGVDSSVVVHLLCAAGYRPTLFYIQIGMEERGFADCSWEDDLEIVQHLARRYDCPLEVVSLHEEYWASVVQYTIDTVKKGLTPNPDMMCNKLIKFGCFEEKWGHDFDFIATGHYATTCYEGDQLYLSTAPDPVKDQTDFLAQINFAQVSKLLFPTGHLLKSEVRQLAEEAHLLSAKRKDSQGICFLGKVNYNEFIERALGTREGLIIERETGKVLGKHRGYWFHTIGQRKGLGLSGGPWFVVKKNIRRNIILVSQGYDPADQYGEHVVMEQCDFISLDPWSRAASLEAGTAVVVPPAERQPIAVSFKIRHTPEFTRGVLSYDPETGYRIDSAEPIQGIAPGQYAVVYSEDHHLCFGSGMITKGF
ncbi:tRNA 2-thiouridine(34) synthase MnmA [uncultured Porphyromonas sp.]|uniref:tRNA 2-thiouridine(34) synthase MnmA n=1 Tax=uncultured Porphyromonas sp. TaxID=159274 RepID=UPI0026111D1A|nr:tRNA 2-thiouridine(34) synthase MnmA [uncultured Porphyromonas sp.]